MRGRRGATVGYDFSVIDSSKVESQDGHGSVSIDRSRVIVGKVGDADPDADYWRNRSPEERIAALEACREAFYGSTAVRGRLSRVLEVTRIR